ncbi:kinase-like domain-containing protein [Gigaspora rosea]|uniref:Kinase-like domain-containing protein n=1 Tax=Gigaspora rosea TaxID=44941 RepID=A0A397VR51_9GLOM|nr:kinase-like domain-containing protein [Gigaspora rosea]
MQCVTDITHLKIWCQACDPQKTIQGWTSGSNEVDDCIKEFQLKAISFEEVIEWIPFNKLGNFQKISRTPSCVVKFKTLTSSPNLLDTLKEKSEFKVYGLTQDTVTNEYMLVFDEFSSERYESFGKCANLTDITHLKLEFQLKAISFEDIIEWISFNKFDNVQKIGGGGFGSVFSATWLDGKRKIYYESKYTQSRTPSCVVALKTLPRSQNNFLKEVYGITPNTTNNEYLMVFQYVNKGSLHEFLLSNIRQLNWKTEFIHEDFHNGNILQNQYINGDLISYIADLGLSRKKDESIFGIIMTKASTGKPPHYKVEYDEILAIKICNRLRPEFANGTSDCYIQLANKCMDANPSNRPNASDIYKICRNNEIIPTLSTELPNYFKDKLISKLLNFKNLNLCGKYAL